LIYYRAMLCMSATSAIEPWLGVCRSVTFVYCVETAKYTAIVGKECELGNRTQISNGRPTVDFKF